MHARFAQSCALTGLQRLSNGMLLIQQRSCIQRRAGRQRQEVRAVGWDPEGILAAPKGGHISRRELAKTVEQNAELKQQVEEERIKARAELIAKREARKAPTSHAETVEYFLETEGEEMEFEVARRRPVLTPQFFQHLSAQIGEERFAKNPSEDRLAELQGLQTFLQQAVEALDNKAKTMTAPLDRMRKLLAAPDKRAMLQEMAVNNEIDQPLLELLQQNADAARAAGQEDPAKFMEKVRDAARKFLITK